MDQLIKIESVNFSELVKTGSLSVLNESLQSKLVETLNHEFTDEEQRWYIANLYVYMHYHPTNEFPINLEHVYKMIGFAHKKNARRTLENNFIQDEDYKIVLPNEKNGPYENEKAASPYGEAGPSKDEVIFRKEKNLGGAGLNKEHIMLNVDTFKNLCMIVKTDKGKAIRKYYVKLENIYNRLIGEEMETTRKLLKETEENMEQREKLNKHKLLIENFKNKPCIYLAEVGDNLIKCGSSQDVDIRKNNLKDVFGKCLFLDIFECTLYNFREIEQYILCKVKDYLYKEPINGHISKEVIKLNDKLFNYNQLRTIVANEIKNYTNKDLEFIRLNNESKKLDIIKDLLSKNFNYEQMDDILNGQNKQEKVIVVEQTEQPEINKSTTIIKKGKRIQAIDPDNLNVVVKVYDSMIYALRDTECNYIKRNIQKAIQNNTIYKGYRWMFIEHGCDPNVVVNIQPTVKSRQTELQTILQLNKDKSEIIESYYGITLIKNKFRVSLPRLHKIIDDHLLFHDSYFIKLQDCPPELKETITFSTRSSSKSIKIKQVNMQTNEEIMYKSITEASIKFGSSEKTISDAIKTKSIINGYKFESTAL
jgi:phage anti-repressor protein